MEAWLHLCETLNLDTLNKVSSRVSTSAQSKTITIPSVAEYRGQNRRLRGVSESGDTLAKGFNAENYVRNCFTEFGPSGIYISNLKVMSLVAGKGQLHPQTPDEIFDYINQNDAIEIDGIFIHFKIGLAVIEIKAIDKSFEVNSKVLPKQITKKAPTQLNKTEQFLKGLYHEIFNEPMYIPVYKVVCAPNTVIAKASVSPDVDILDSHTLETNDGILFKQFWRGKMTFVERTTANANFRKFSAVLISLKTGFNCASQYNSVAMSKTHNIITQRLSVSDVETESNFTIMQGKEKMSIWFNEDQQDVMHSNPGQHYLNGVPGSGKTLLLMMKVLNSSNSNRTAVIFCPNALVYLYQQFVKDNTLGNTVQVKTYAELCKIASLFSNKPEKFNKSEHAALLSKNVDMYCDEMDFNTLVKTKLFSLLETRPKEAETLVVGESPEAPKTAVHDIFKIAASSFTRRYLNIMMRNSKEIMDYYKKIFDPDALIGHSTSTTAVKIQPCKNQRILLAEIVRNIHLLVGNGLELRDLAVISMNRQKRDIEYALTLSNIASKNLANNNYEANAVTVLSPVEIKSYEWKAVIISTDYDHERELALAVTRAILKLIILKDIAYEETIKEFLKNRSCSPEETLMRLATTDDVYKKLKANFSAFPNVHHIDRKPTKHCRNPDEYRNWCIFGTLQECGYSSKSLQRLHGRLIYEQNNMYHQRINRKMEAARSADMFGSLPKGKASRKLRRPSQLSLIHYSEKNSMPVEKNHNPFGENIALRGSYSTTEFAHRSRAPLTTDEVSRMNMLLNNGSVKKSNMSPKLRHRDTGDVSNGEFKSYSYPSRKSRTTATTPHIQTVFQSHTTANQLSVDVESKQMHKIGSTSSRRLSHSPRIPHLSISTIEEEKENEEYLTNKPRTTDSSSSQSRNFDHSKGFDDSYSSTEEYLYKPHPNEDKNTLPRYKTKRDTANLQQQPTPLSDPTREDLRLLHTETEYGAQMQNSRRLADSKTSSPSSVFTDGDETGDLPALYLNTTSPNISSSAVSWRGSTAIHRSSSLPDFRSVMSASSLSSTPVRPTITDRAPWHLPSSANTIDIWKISSNNKALNDSRTAGETSQNNLVYIPVMDPDVKTNGSTKARVLRFQLGGEEDLNTWANHSIKSSPFDEAISGNQMLKDDNLRIFESLMIKTCAGQIANEKLLASLREEAFDLAITECYDFCSFGIFKLLNIPVSIAASAVPLTDTIGDLLGVPEPFSYIPNMLSPFTDEMSYFERAQNLYIAPQWKNFHLQIEEKENELFRKFHGEDFPSVRELAKKTALAFINSDEFFEFARPITHRIIYISGFAATTSPKPLSKAIKEIIDKSVKGVVLMSFGSLANSTLMPLHKKQAFLQSFSSFPDYHFVWKYELPERDQDIFLKYKNAHPLSWLPQVDLLNHPKVMAFITHGGMNSIMESVNSGTPMIAIPLFGDQEHNVAVAVKRGVAVKVDKSKITTDTVTNALREVLDNKIYATNAKRLASMIAKKPFKPAELLVKWTEFAAEFQDLSNLDIAGRDFSVVKYYCLDILTPLLSITFITLFILLKLIKFLIERVIGMTKSSKQKVN